MKRMWIGGGLLAILLAASLLVNTALERRIAPDAESLRQAGYLAMAGEWEQAITLSEQAKQSWEDMQWAAEILTGQKDLSQIAAAFEQLQGYLYINPTEYQSLCIALANDLDTIIQTHDCTWKNFF